MKPFKNRKSTQPQEYSPQLNEDSTDIQWPTTDAAERKRKGTRDVLAVVAVGLALPGGLAAVDGPGGLGAHDALKHAAADIQEHGGEAPDVPRIVTHDHAAEVRALLPEITDTDARERAEASVEYAVRSIESRDGLLPTTIPSGFILAGIAASAVGSRRKKLEDGHVGQEVRPEAPLYEPLKSDSKDYGYIDEPS